jgi:HSP20 family protein
MEDYINADLIVKKNRAAAKPPEEGHLTVDVFKDGDNVVVQSTIAGTDPKDMDISITKDTVTIRGTRKTENEISNSNYYHQELYWGSFSRSVILPIDIDPDRSKASIKNGVLTIRLPKLKKSQ